MANPIEEAANGNNEFYNDPVYEVFNVTTKNAAIPDHGWSQQGDDQDPDATP